MSGRSPSAGSAAGGPLVVLVGLPAPGVPRLRAEALPAAMEGGMSGPLDDLPTIPLGLAAPARFGKRATVRMRGAIECTAAGVFGRPSDNPAHHHFNLSSLELVGPRAHPVWRIQLQREGGAISRVIVTRKDAPYMDGVQAVGKAGDPGWSATFSEDGRTLRLHALLPAAAAAEPALELAIRVEWPPAREPAAAPAPIRALLERHTGMVARKFSTWDFGRERDPECASVILDTEEQALAVVRAVRGDLPQGWVAFLGTRRWLDSPGGKGREGKARESRGREVLVAPGAGWADILRTARLDPVNSGLTTESVVRWLAEYERTLGIDVLGASTDTLDFTLRRAPPDVPRFVDDLTDLCPDLLDTSRGDTEAMVEGGTIQLWWD